MYRRVLLFCVLIGSISCSIREDEKPEDKINKPKPELEQSHYDFGDHGLPLSIEARQGFIDSFQVQWKPAFGRLEIQSKNGAHFFIQKDTLSCPAKELALKADVLRNEIIESNDSLFIYRTTAPEGQLAYHHFFASFSIDSVNYTFQNNPLVEYSEADIRQMTRLVKKIEGS
jgi:hypothetical protein